MVYTPTIRDGSFLKEVLYLVAMRVLYDPAFPARDTYRPPNFHASILRHSRVSLQKEIPVRDTVRKSRDLVTKRPCDAPEIPLADHAHLYLELLQKSCRFGRYFILQTFLVTVSDLTPVGGSHRITL